MENTIFRIAQSARAASHKAARLSSDTKNDALARLAGLLVEHTDDILQTNAKDLAAAEQDGLSKAMVDRLKFTPERIQAMAEGLRQVIALPDPVGETLEETTRPNGIRLVKRRVPFGVIGIIYESRPNVTIDCAALCLKSGNACILRGGKEAFHTNTHLAQLIQQALVDAGIPAETVQLVPTTEREALKILLKLDDLIHCIIPRGGENLIRFVAEHSRIPVIKHYKGVCNLYIDKEADPELARSITLNAKCQRPGVCNAIENLFVHKDVAKILLPGIARELEANGVELRIHPKDAEILESAGIDYKLATEEDFHEEYLDLILSIMTVGNLEEAIDAVNTYGSGHSDAIVTKDEEAAETFLTSVDTSTAYWNASTRFTDGFEFGLGAEIGISTDRLHARGPMGLRELCTYKFIAYGNGQTKQ
jgi:glutamate-5-semialdehyde dehydrogenase